MKKISMCVMLCLLMMITACGKEKVEKQETEQLRNNEIYIYYLNLEQTDLYAKPFKLTKSDDVLPVIESVISALETVEDSEAYLSPIPKGIIYTSCNHGQRKGNVELHYDVMYDSVTAENLLFFKACVVKSVLNIEGVSSVTLYLTDLASSDLDTATVSESFDNDSFNLVFDDENGYTQQGTITVYFANPDGTILKEYRKVVEISNNTSLPRLVVETLINGPDSEEYRETIPPDTKIQKISVKDGICYVDLSDEFYDSNNTLSNDIIIYSIVNSLVELPNVTKVQFLKNGEKQALFRESFPFDGIFERNLDLIEQEVTTEKDTEDTTEQSTEAETDVDEG